MLTYLLFAALQIPLANHLQCTFHKTLEVPCDISIASLAFHVKNPFFQRRKKAATSSIGEFNDRRGMKSNDLFYYFLSHTNELLAG